MSTSTAAGNEVVRIQVWQIPVRVTHWLIVLSIAVLSVTGIYLGRPFLLAPGAAGQRFVMGVVRLVHDYAAIVFTLSVASRIAWMFLGNRWARWTSFVPVTRQRWRDLWPTLKFYTFLRRDPPPSVGHNPLAGLSYVAVFALYLVMIATGLALYAPHTAESSYMRWFGFLVPLVGGEQTGRWLHHVVMWLLLGFTVHHIYSATLWSHVEADGTMDSIVTGNKFVSREKLAQADDPPGDK
jgi:Ni/Fe-hydrogenase 1 B-type cytochrome subunit